MNDYTNSVVNKSLTLKLWRGERMCLLGMDVANPEDDFVGSDEGFGSSLTAVFLLHAPSYPLGAEPSRRRGKTFSPACLFVLLIEEMP